MQCLLGLCILLIILIVISHNNQQCLILNLVVIGICYFTFNIGSGSYIVGGKDNKVINKQSNKHKSGRNMENKGIIYIKLDIPAIDHIRRIFNEYDVKEPVCRSNKCYLNNDSVVLYFPTGIHNFGLQPTQYKNIKFKSRLIIDITNKETLHKNHQHGLAETYFLDDIKTYMPKLQEIANSEPNSLWIARPTYGFAGSDISYIQAKHFNTEIHKLNDKFMLSRVVQYPYLMEGRKIHIRRYAFAVYYGETKHKRFGLVKNGVIGYAKGLYDPQSLDLSIQDTHFKGRELVKYPDDFPTKSYIPKFEKDLIEILTPIVQKANISMYNDKGIANAFEFLALDILIDTKNTDDYNTWQVVLLEINHKPGILAGTTDKPFDHCEYPLYDKLKYSHAHYFEYITDTVFGSLKEFILDDKDGDKIIQII